MLRKTNASVAGEGSSQLKERLREAEQELRRTTRELQDAQAEHIHMITQLQQLATSANPAESVGDDNHAAEEAGHLVSRVKAQQLDMWREIERLQQVGFY